MATTENKQGLSAFEEAWLEALVRAEDKTAESGSVAKPSRGGGNGHRTPVVHKPVISYRRSILRATLDETVGTFQEEPVVHRRTVHIAPQGVQVAEQERKALEGKLMYQAGKLGSVWSKWINASRPGGWRQVDPKLAADWTVFAGRLGEFDMDSRTPIIEALARGMGLEGNLLRAGTLANDNKLAYVVNTMTTDRRHLGIGVSVSLSPRGIDAGAMLVISLGHLSGLERGSDALRALRSSIMEQSEKVANLDLKNTCIAASDWLGRDETKAHFARSN